MSSWVIQLPNLLSHPGPNIFSNISKTVFIFKRVLFKIILKRAMQACQQGTVE